MTVGQLVARLKEYNQDSLVYVPYNLDGKNGTAQFIANVHHTNLPIPGISISSDVAILPGLMEDFVCDGDSDEERQGES